MAKPEIISAPQLSLDQLDRLEATDLVLWLASDERPLKGSAGFVDWRANGWLSHLVASGQFKCDKGERMLTLSQGRLKAQRVFLIGLGEAKGYNARSAAEVAGDTAQILDEAAATNIALGIPGMGDADAHRQLFDSLVLALSKQKRSTQVTTWGPWRKL